MRSIHQTVLNAVAGAIVALCTIVLAGPAFAYDDNLIETIKAVEKRIGGRVGAAIYDTETGRNWEYRARERFPLSSTFKAFACAAVLSRVDQGAEQLDRVIEIQESDLVTYSPVTEKRIGTEGMTLSDLCNAAVTLSDNTAGNIILQSLGGPEGFTNYMRTIGDPMTHLDRWETTLNEGAPNDMRDTTTPQAAANSLHTVLLGDVLSASSRQQIIDWMRSDQVAGALFRSAVPTEWQIADKTGAGGHGSRSIIAVMWPPQRKPIIATVYMTDNSAEFADRNAAIAEIGAAIVSATSP